MLEIVNDTIDCIVESILYNLKEIKPNESKEIYFHDIVSEEIDTQISTTDRQEQLDLIDESDEQYFDSGLIDNSSLDRTLLTMGYCALEQLVFNDDFMQELQDKLNNENIEYNDAQELIKEIEEKIQ